MSTELKKETAEAISRWNPFNASVTEEEDLFGAEFDKIRQEGWKILSNFSIMFKVFCFTQAQNQRDWVQPLLKIPFKHRFHSDSSEPSVKMGAWKSTE